VARSVYDVEVVVCDAVTVAQAAPPRNVRWIDEMFQSVVVRMSPTAWVIGADHAIRSPPRHRQAPAGARWFTSQTWKKAREAIGRPDLRWHDLRLTAVALAIANGAHPKAIQERMGHSSITVTLDRYGHLFPSLSVAVADGLEATLRAAAGGGAPHARVTSRVS
jgi:Phage integrase family